MLCDIRMPNMSGVELVPKALAADTDLAIIMLTAIDEPRTAIECLKLGAYDYLIKPVDLDELEMSLQGRSEEHTSELQSPCNLVCRLLLEKKKTRQLRSQVLMWTAHR